MSDLKNINYSMDKEADLSGTIFTASIGYNTNQMTQPESEDKKPQSHEKPKRIKLHPIQISTEKEPVDIKEEDVMATELLKRVMENNSRTDEEAWMIYEAIKTFKFFEEVFPGKNDPETLLKIGKALKYRRVRAGRPVFVEGELANENVYILYSGSLSVMSKNTIVEDASQLSPAKSTSKSKIMFDYGLETIPTTTRKPITHANTLENLPDVTEPVSNLITRRNYGRQKTFKERQLTRMQTITKVQSETKFTQIDEPDSPISICKEFVNLKDDLNEENSPGMSPIESVKEKRDTESLYGRVRGTIEKGEHFGDQVLEPEAKRSTTVLANVNSELLVLAGSTLNALKNEFSKTMKKIQSFLIERIPGLDFISAKAIMKRHMNLLEETSFCYGNHIINEGDKGDRFYIICEGACEVYRTVKIEEPESLAGNYSKIKNTFFSQTHSIKEKIVLTKLKAGALIGEEILFSENSCYTYSIQVISDACKTIALKKELASKFPKEVLQKLQQGFEDKKNYKDRLLCQSLEKRDVQFAKGAFDTPFLTVKRNAAPQDVTSTITKINHVPSQFESYKIMTDNISQNEINTPTGTSAIYLPKLNKPKHMTFKEPLEIHRKQKFLSFSRAHLMPQRDKDASKRRSPSEQKIPDKLPMLVGMNSHENSVVEGNSSVDHIRIGKVPVAYNDITDIYHDLSPKLNLKMNNNEAKANLYNADYFKFDFGEPEPEVKRGTRLVRKDKSNTLIGNVPSSLSSSPLRKHIHHATQLTQISTGSVTSTNQLNSLLKNLDFDKINAANAVASSINSKEIESRRVNDKPQPVAWESSGTETLITLQSLTTRPQKFDPSFLRDFAPKPKLKPRGDNPIKNYGVNNTSYTGNSVRGNQRQHHLSMKMDYKKRLEGSLEQASQEQEMSYLAALPETPVRKAFVSLKRGNIPSLKAVQLGPLKLLQEKFEKLKIKEVKRKI